MQNLIDNFGQLDGSTELVLHMHVCCFENNLLSFFFHWPGNICHLELAWVQQSPACLHITIGWSRVCCLARLHPSFDNHFHYHWIRSWVRLLNSAETGTGVKCCMSVFDRRQALKLPNSPNFSYHNIMIT